MRTSIPEKNHITTLLCLLLLPAILDGQSYKFKNFGTDNRLTDKYVYTISQDNDGFLWIGTGSGLVRFDGVDFYNVPYPDTIISRYTSVSLKDKNGNLWFGCNDGSLFYTRGNRLIKIPDLKVQSINYLLEGEDGYLYIIPQDKIILKININKPEEITRFYLSRDLSMTTACFTSPDSLLIGTQENLLYCNLRKDSVAIINRVEGIENSKVEIIRKLKNKGSCLVGTEERGLFIVDFVNGKPVLGRFRNHPEFATINVKSIIED